MRVEEVVVVGRDRRRRRRVHRVEGVRARLLQVVLKLVVEWVPALLPIWACPRREIGGRRWPKFKHLVCGWAKKSWEMQRCSWCVEWWW